MDFSSRLGLYKDGGIICDKDIADIHTIEKYFKDNYELILNEDNAEPFIAHLCAAFHRMATDEDIEKMPDALIDEMKEMDTYEESQKVLKEILDQINNNLSENERDYVSLYINNLLGLLKGGDNL